MSDPSVEYQESVDAMVASARPRLPLRTQRRGLRTALPEGVRYVGRPTRWGNPYRVGPTDRYPDGVELTLAEAVALFGDYARRRLEYEPGWLDPLWAAGALACWCAPGGPCHVDVLLELMADQAARGLVLGRPPTFRYVEVDGLRVPVLDR